jgi:hypothetical protein
LVSMYGKLDKPLPFPLKSKSVILFILRRQWLHKNAMSVVKEGASWHPTSSRKFYTIYNWGKEYTLVLWFMWPCKILWKMKIIICFVKKFYNVKPIFTWKFELFVSFSIMINFLFCLYPLIQ